MWNLSTRDGVKGCTQKCIEVPHKMVYKGCTQKCCTHSWAQAFQFRAHPNYIPGPNAMHCILGLGPLNGGPWHGPSPGPKPILKSRRFASQTLTNFQWLFSLLLLIDDYCMKICIFFN